MSVKFLSQSYLDAATAALVDHSGFRSAIRGVELSMQFNVTDGPKGQVTYHVAISDNTADVGLGQIAEPDITITNSYETAAGIATGAINTQMAFMTGKLKVAGEMGKLMMNQSVITEMGRALMEVDTEY